MGMKSLAWKSRYWSSFEGFRHYGHSNWLLHYFGLRFVKTLRRKNHFPPQPHMLWHSRKIQEENLTLKNERYLCEYIRTQAEKAYETRARKMKFFAKCINHSSSCVNFFICAKDLLWIWAICILRMNSYFLLTKS